jgi:hypothetical protein
VNTNWGLDCQALAALAAAASDDGSTCRCSHASSKAVFVVSFSIAWLEGSLHESLPGLAPAGSPGHTKPKLRKYRLVGRLSIHTIAVNNATSVRQNSESLAQTLDAIYRNS